MISGSPFLGIDFGTCNSSMAWFNPKTRQAEVLKNAEGEDKTRSLVYFGDGERLVGTPAEHMLADEVTRSLVYPSGAKRNIGKKMVMVLGNSRVTPLDVAVEVLRKLKRDAEELHFHTAVSRAVITVPAMFDQIEREKIQEAGHSAGFIEVVLLDEPVAAALAYARDGLAVGRRILVYDLGAGTFDLALLARDSDEKPVLALPARGLRKGGEDFDFQLYRYVDQRAKEEGRSLSKDGWINSELLRHCRDRKENLSFRSESLFSSILPDGRPFRYKLDRKTFETLIVDILNQTVDQTEKLLQDAKAQGHEIDTVVLVGGSSRIPLVAAMLQVRLPVKPQKWQHQDIAVAIGAAYHAETIWGATDHGRKQVIAATMSAGMGHNKVAQAAPFRFRSGAEASNLKELVALCEKHWEDAKWHLMEGHFERWLLEQGDYLLAQRAISARTYIGGSSHHNALLYFLEGCGLDGWRVAQNPALASPHPGAANAVRSRADSRNDDSVSPTNPTPPNSKNDDSASPTNSTPPPMPTLVKPGDPVDVGAVIGVVLGGLIGAVLGGLIGTKGVIAGAFGGALCGVVFLGPLFGAGIGWMVKQADAQQRSVEETYWVVAGYICAAVSLFFCPPLFGVAGVFIGLRNQGVPGNAVHGRFHVGLSITGGLFGMIFWAIVAGS